MHYTLYNSKENSADTMYLIMFGCRRQPWSEVFFFFFNPRLTHQKSKQLTACTRPTLASGILPNPHPLPPPSAAKKKERKKQTKKELQSTRLAFRGGRKKKRRKEAVHIFFFREFETDFASTCPLLHLLLRRVVASSSEDMLQNIRLF